MIFDTCREQYAYTSTATGAMLRGGSFQSVLHKSSVSHQNIATGSLLSACKGVSTMFCMIFNLEQQCILQDAKICPFWEHADFHVDAGQSFDCSPRADADHKCVKISQQPAFHSFRLRARKLSISAWHPQVSSSKMLMDIKFKTGPFM